MKNKIKTLFFAIFLISCNNVRNENTYLKEGFISKEGNYYAKNIKVVVKKLDDGSFIYAICDRYNKNLYQSNIMQPFSQYHFWMIYLDNKENIWTYNSDFDSRKVIIKEHNSKLYFEKDPCLINISIPKEIHNKFKELKISDCK